MTKLKCVAVDFELADSFVVGDVYDARRDEYDARHDGACYYVEDEYGIEWAILPDDKCFEVVE
ncbi:hypothetical protein BN201_0235 [Enterobacteria phage GEC-3S]|uniref:Uncharacterized protein n=1 Tax=Enterobacteria phage GEC-3S TaxID=1222338 RepID=A0A0B7MRQ9_9CAUD|nr:hypothetical protein BN201_0235 [Enterobacteria phage GEC-3S]CEO90838.1 hypothetical protein BN201_0235 [Enterobacteria phage GEC-3S]